MYFHLPIAGVIGKQKIVENNQTVGLMELVEAIEKASGIEADKKHVAKILDNIEQTWTDIGKSQKLLGYSPDFDLKKELNKFAEWYSKK